MVDSFGLHSMLCFIFSVLGLVKLLMTMRCRQHSSHFFSGGQRRCGNKFREIISAEGKTVIHPAG